MTRHFACAPPYFRADLGRKIRRLVAVLLAGTPTLAAHADVYVADTTTKTIYQFNGDGVATTFSNQANHPVGLALDGAGNLYGSDVADGMICRYVAGGARIVFADLSAHSFGLAFDRVGNLFVSTATDEPNSGAIFKISPAGARSPFATGLKKVRGLAFDGADSLYVADLESGCVYRFGPDGTRGTFAAGLEHPSGLAFDGSGNLFVCGQGAGVYKITPAGIVSTFTKDVIDPRWLAFDPTGNLYVTDVGNATGTAGHGRIYRFTATGERTLFADNLSFPTGVVIGIASVPARDYGLEAVSGVGVAGQLSPQLDNAAGMPLIVSPAASKTKPTPATRQNAPHK